MKLPFIRIAVASLIFPIYLSAQSIAPVEPVEMVGMCGSLVTYVSLATEAKKSGMPLDAALNMTEASMKKNLSSLPPDTLERYRASVRELFKRIYALADLSPQTTNREIAPSCVMYCAGQYTEADIGRLQVCQAKTQPYLGFANMRDQGMSLDNQLKWLKETAVKNAAQSVAEQDRIYAELSEMMRYVYANPQMTKGVIFSEKFNACYKSAK